MKNKITNQIKYYSLLVIILLSISGCMSMKGIIQEDLIVDYKTTDGKYIYYFDEEYYFGNHNVVEIYHKKSIFNKNRINEGDSIKIEPIIKYSKIKKK